jgi:hypothetical protein
MEHKNTIFTRQLDLIEYENCLYEILDFFKDNKVIEVEIMFGWTWGNEYKNWTPFTIAIEGVVDEIDKANKSGSGSFYDDDMVFYLNNIGIEILFCHEHDIHLNYNEANELINKIIDARNAKNIIHEKRNGGQ